MSSFNRIQDNSEENETKKQLSKQTLQVQEEPSRKNKPSISSQKSLNAEQQLTGEQTTLQNGVKIKLPDKDDKKMKRYLIKIFEKLKDSQNNMGNMMGNNNDSPDLLNEHSNSVQEQLLKKENQSSLTEFNSSLIIKNGRVKDSSGTNMGLPNGRNGIGNIKMQFHTQNNFYPSSKQSQPIFKSRTTGSQAYNDKLQQRLHKYEQAENFIQEESGEDNQPHSGEDEDDFQQTTLQQYENTTNLNQATEKIKINKGRKIKKNTDAYKSQNQNNFNIINTPGGSISNEKQHQQYLQKSPGQMPNQVYQNNPIPIIIGNQSLNERGTMRIIKNDSSYHEIMDRSATNRTPILNHYQDNNSSLTRGNANNYNSYVFSNSNHHTSNSNNSTSVPRPTLASEIKLLKEINGGQQSPQAQGLNNKKVLSVVSNQFVQNNNLASFMWNQNFESGSGMGQINIQREVSSKQGTRGYREYSLNESTTNANQTQGRPMTRSNQRRPASRQVNQFDNSGISASKMLVQQQMRNTHFGDGSFGFGQGFKADFSIDSERQASKKRGQRIKEHPQLQNQSKLEENPLRESLKIGITNGQVNGIVSGGGNTTMLNQNNASLPLNRSITFNSKQISKNIKQNQSNIPINSYNNEQISTQESSGSHFYQPSSFLNKSIESSSSRGLIISAKHHQQQNTMNSIIKQNSEEPPMNTNQSIIKQKQKINIPMGGTQYENNCFKLVQREENIINNSNSSNSQNIYNHQQQQLPIKQFQNIKNLSFKEQSVSPHLNSIQEITNQQHHQQTLNNKIHSVASNTQTKFYQQQQNNPKQHIQTASRNIAGYLQQQNSDGFNEGKQDIKRSQNTTQEKFFPLKQQQLQQYQQYNSNQIPNQQHIKTFNQQKSYNTAANITSNGNECKISQEFPSSQGQTPNYDSVKSHVIKRQHGKSNNRMKEGRSEMIKEEQHEEFSEDDTIAQQQYRDERSNSIQKKQRINKFHENTLDDYQSQDSIQVSSQPILSQTGQIERPTNRLGCSRAFHKDIFQEQVNEYSSVPSNYHQNQSGAHSMPRSNIQNNQSFNENEINQKTTSSASSLILNKQGNSNSSTNHTQQLNNIYQGSSISPKPNKWHQQREMNPNQTNNNQSANQAAKFQEMQKEVNMMYLGGLQQKKKVSAGIKLNPISRIASTD